MNYNANPVLCATCLASSWLVLDCDRCTQVIEDIYQRLYAIKHAPIMSSRLFYNAVDAHFSSQQLHVLLINKFPFMTADALQWIDGMSKHQQIETIWLFCLSTPSPTASLAPTVIEASVPVVELEDGELPEHISYFFDRVGDRNQRRQDIQRRLDINRRQEIHQNFLPVNLLPDLDNSAQEAWANELFQAEYNRYNQVDAPILIQENRVFDVKVTMFRKTKSDSKTFHCCACMDEEVEQNKKIQYDGCVHSNCLECFQGMLGAAKLGSIPKCPECRAAIKHVKVANKETKNTLATLCCPIIKNKKPTISAVSP